MADTLFRYTQFSMSDDRLTAAFGYQIVREGMEHNLTEKLTFPEPLPETEAEQAALAVTPTIELKGLLR